MKTAGHRDGRGRFVTLETDQNHALLQQAGMAQKPRLMETLPGLAAWLEEGGLTGEWRLALGREVRAAAAFAPLSVDLLTPGELARYRTLQDTSRRRAWLTGRAALRRLLRRLDRGPDTAGLDFPRPDMSLAHCAGLSVAVAALDAGAAGLGVDLESERPMPPEAASFFLTERERARLDKRPSPPEAEIREAALMRLWTVKEALFKADPANRTRILADYEVADAALRRGKAGMRQGLDGRKFRYVSHRLAGWHLTLATALQ